MRGRREQELILDAGRPTQPQSPEAQDTFEMGEQHLDLLPTAASDLKFRRLGKSPRHIARFFFNVPRNLAPDIIWAALRFEFAGGDAADPQTQDRSVDRLRRDETFVGFTQNGDAGHNDQRADEDRRKIFRLMVSPRQASRSALSTVMTML